MKLNAPRPYHLPGAITHVRNYRSKPNEPWVLVKVTGVSTGWSSNGTGHNTYRCVRLASADQNDYYRNVNRYGKEMGPVFLTVGDDKISETAITTE